MFNRGEQATVVRNDYAEPYGRDFVGETGEVIGESGGLVIVRFPGETQSYGFEPQEVDRVR